MTIVRVLSERVSYTQTHIKTKYTYNTTEIIDHQSDCIKVAPVSVECEISTEVRVPRVGVMLVGWGGNNGSTLTSAILANRLGLQWRTRRGWQGANYLGSLTQCSTVQLTATTHVPFNNLLPMLQPNDIVLDGWDISGANLFESMRRAQVLDVGLQEQLESHMTQLTPRAAVFDPDFVAANQQQRADNIVAGSRQQQLDQVRADIRHFRAVSGVDRVLVVWTANTERFCDERAGVNLTADELLASVTADDRRNVAPSTIYALAAVLEECAFINGSPQNTCVPGVLELAERRGVYVAGDDFKSGQTKLKSVLVDFLVSAGIKPVSIVSYNHLGNNDGLNLSAPLQFRSKEISKSNVVDDMVASNPILYKPGEKPDHCVVIKYVPYVGDSKRAMDEYTSELMCGGVSTIVVHNTCEDSLLAAPIILDLVVLTELVQRIQIRLEGEREFHGFHSVLSLLGFLCKAPLVPTGAPVVNALFRQRACLENLVRACVGLPPVNELSLEHRLPAGCWPSQESVVQNSTRQQPSGGVAWKQNGYAHAGNDNLIAPQPAPSSGTNGHH